MVLHRRAMSRYVLRIVLRRIMQRFIAWFGHMTTNLWECLFLFGRVAPELGKKILRETIILDARTNVPILSIQPFNQDGYDYAVKVRTTNVADHDDLQRMARYQIRKFNACRKCLKCESICRQGAISITGDSYYIDSDKCVHCKMCMTAKYLDGGCMMDKYLRTK